MKIKTWQERVPGLATGNVSATQIHEARDQEIAELRVRIKELERPEREPPKRTGVTDPQILEMFKHAQAVDKEWYSIGEAELIFGVRKLFKLAQQKRK